MEFPNASNSFRKANPNLFKGGEAKCATAATSALSNAAPKVPSSGAALPYSRKMLMNKWESKFAVKLEADRLDGKIEDWKYEAIRLRLADRTTYTPDFFVIEIHGTDYGNGIKIQCQPWFRFIEIKGFRRDDAMVKFKIARELYPWAEFEMWSLVKKVWTRVA